MKVPKAEDVFFWSIMVLIVCLLIVFGTMMVGWD